MPCTDHSPDAGRAAQVCGAARRRLNNSEGSDETHDRWYRNKLLRFFPQIAEEQPLYVRRMRRWFVVSAGIAFSQLGACGPVAPQSSTPSAPSIRTGVPPPSDEIGFRKLL